MSTESRRIRVLLVDDHSIMREGLQSMLKDSEEFEVVGQARDGVEAVRAASELSPDVIVMDVIMPGKDGVEAVRAASELSPDVIVMDVIMPGKDGVEAVRAASELSPDVIVMDVIMPGKDGVEAVRAASELSPDVIVMDVIMPGKDGVEACPGDHGVRARHAGDHADRLGGGGGRDRGGGRWGDRLPSEGVRHGPAPEHAEARGCG